MDETVLTYSGDGAWLPGVPKRDLTQADVETCGRSVAELVASGLYRSAARSESAVNEDGSDKRTKRSKA